MSLTLLASNNASTVLASSINASATTLTVNTGAGSLFPSPVAGTSFFKLTLIDAATGQLTEIVHVTARTGDVMTIERAQEGTAARAWSANDIAANMMTAGTLSYILGSFQPLDATLTALAALTGAADKLAYFNGADTAALTALTAVGRDIIGKATVADVLTYLGLGNSATRNVGTTTGTVAAGDDSRLSSILGVGQTWQDVTASRAAGVTYTNSAGRPIFVIVTGRDQSSGGRAYVDGLSVGGFTQSSTGTVLSTISFIVPDGSTYSVSSGVSITGADKQWVELR